MDRRTSQIVSRKEIGLSRCHSFIPETVRGKRAGHAVVLSFLALLPYMANVEEAAATMPKEPWAVYSWGGGGDPLTIEIETYRRFLHSKRSNKKLIRAGFDGRRKALDWLEPKLSSRRALPVVHLRMADFEGKSYVFGETVYPNHAKHVLRDPRLWRHTYVQSLMDEWLRTATPPLAPVKGGPWRYSPWGQTYNDVTVKIPAPPPTKMSRHEYLWGVSKELKSARHYTMREYVERRLLGKSGQKVKLR